MSENKSEYCKGTNLLVVFFGTLLIECGMLVSVVNPVYSRVTSLPAIAVTLAFSNCTFLLISFMILTRSFIFKLALSIEDFKVNCFALVSIPEHSKVELVL